MYVEWNGWDGMDERKMSSQQFILALGPNILVLILTMKLMSLNTNVFSNIKYRLSGQVRMQKENQNETSN